MNSNKKEDVYEELAFIDHNDFDFCSRVDGEIEEIIEILEPRIASSSNQNFASEK